MTEQLRDGINHQPECQYVACGLEMCPKCGGMRKIHDSSEALAFNVQVGDQVLMPDNETWCTIDSIQHEPPSGRLFMSHIEGGFSSPDPKEVLTIRRATEVQRLRVTNKRLEAERAALLGWLEKLEVKADCVPSEFAEGWNAGQVLRYVRVAIADDRVVLELEVG